MKIPENAKVSSGAPNEVVCTVPPEEVARVKGLGCLWDKRTPDRFNMRVLTVNGKLTSEKLSAIAEAAKRFGSGEAAMTSRLTVEIQGIPYENIEPIREFLAGYGLESGGTGAKVRPVVSCKGTSCRFGLIDTFSLSEQIHERFYKGWHDVKLPHKFKIGVGGCPNNCVKPNLNDVGIIGARVPLFDADKCRGCKTCQLAKECPVGAVSVVDGKAVIDSEKCINCGRCAAKCPFGAAENYINGYRVYLGGRWGKSFAHGRPMETLFTSEEEVLEIIEKAILFFRDRGNSGERFADTINRIGFEEACRIIESDELPARKAEILAK